MDGCVVVYMTSVCFPVVLLIVFLLVIDYSHSWTFNYVVALIHLYLFVCIIYAVHVLIQDNIKAVGKIYKNIIEVIIADITAVVQSCLYRKRTGLITWCHWIKSVLTRIHISCLGMSVNSFFQIGMNVLKTACNMMCVTFVFSLLSCRSICCAE